jgi:hypothetical protein
VLPAHPRRPSQIIGALLTGHPEAAGLLAEAIHCQALARSSAVNVGQEFAAAQTVRLHYEELCHKRDPHRRRTIHFGTGLLLLLMLGTVLTMLNGIELSGLLGGMRLVLVAFAATTVWLTSGWLAALASRERRWPLLLATINTAIFLTLLLMTLHGLEPRPDRPAARDHLRECAVFGVLAGFFILVLVVGAAAFIAHMESASLCLARRRWHRGRAAHKAAIQTEREVVAASSAATEAWLGLVRSFASVVAGGDDHLVRETVALAVALLESGGPQLLPP